MPTAIKTIPKTLVFLDDVENPTIRVVEDNLVGGNDGNERFTLRTSLLNSPLLSVSQDIGTLQLQYPVKVQYGQFVLVYKSITVAPYTDPQQYAFPVQTEILNNVEFDSAFPPAFEELV